MGDLSDDDIVSMCEVVHKIRFSTSQVQQKIIASLRSRTPLAIKSMARAVEMAESFNSSRRIVTMEILAKLPYLGIKEQLKAYNITQAQVARRSEDLHGKKNRISPQAVSETLQGKPRNESVENKLREAADSLLEEKGA